MENPSTTAELRSAEQERAYRAGKKVVNRELLKSFVFICFVLALAVTVATVLAKGLNDVPKLNGVSDVIVTKCRQLTTGGHFERMCSIANELTMPNLVNHIDKSENWPHSCAKHTVSPRPSV